MDLRKNSIMARRIANVYAGVTGTIVSGGTVLDSIEAFIIKYDKALESNEAETEGVFHYTHLRLLESQEDTYSEYSDAVVRWLMATK